MTVHVGVLFSKQLTPDKTVLVSLRIEFKAVTVPQNVSCCETTRAKRPALELNQLLSMNTSSYCLSNQGMFRGQMARFEKTSRLQHDQYMVVKQKLQLVDEYVVRV